MITNPDPKPGKMELLLDSDIRWWVVLPIFAITFLFGILRHYISLLIKSNKKLDKVQIMER
jgi:ER membrane protein complex subunit 3